MDWPKGFHFTAKQAVAWKLLQGPQTYTLLVGGARAAKTFLLVLAIIWRAIAAPNSRHLIARSAQNAARRSIWLDTLPRVMALCFPSIRLKTHAQDGYVTLPNGSEIWITGLDDKERVEKILGMEFVTIFLNECSQIAYSTVVIVLTRLAQRVTSSASGRLMKPRCYCDLNPTGTGHWTHRLFIEKVDPESRRPVADPSNYQSMYMTPRDNLENLAEGVITQYEALPERQRKRFLDGVYQNEIEGALWTLETISKQRIELPTLYDPQATYDDVPSMKRIVVSIDPSGTSGDEEKRSNDVGIVVAGLGDDDQGYVFADLTANLAPERWAARAVEAFDKFDADRIIAEINYGGDMVRAVIQSHRRAVPVRIVTASRGKHVRAEPVSLLYEQGKVWHVGPASAFMRLEDQLCNFSTAGYQGDKSPDRADALIWAMTELMVKKPGERPNSKGPRTLPIFAR